MEVTQPLVECRHLAFNYLFADEPTGLRGGKDFLDGVAKSKPDLQTFYTHPSDPHARADNGTDELEFRTGRNNPLLTPAHFPRWLDDMVRQVVDKGLPEARIMLRTYNHDLPVHIQNKDQRITVAFYDPNDTNVHRRIERYPDKSISDVTFDQAFPDNEGYFKAGRYPFIQAVSGDVGHPANDMKYFRDGSRLPVQVDKKLLFSLWNVNSSQAFLGLCEYMSRKGLVGSKAVPYLQANPERLRRFAQGVIDKTMNYDLQHRSFRVMATGLSTLKVSPSVARQILAPRVEGARNPIGCALHSKTSHPEFVTDYLRLLRVAGLRSADRFDVIRGEPGDNNVAVAMEHQKLNDFHRLFDELEKLRLDKGQLAGLLGARTSSGGTALSDAASFGHPAMVDAFVKRVSQSAALDKKEKHRLLQGKDNDVDTCLQRAAAYEDAGCISAYLSALRSGDFSSRELGKLLGNPEQDQPNIIPDICLSPSTGWTPNAVANVKAMLVAYFSGIAALSLQPRTLHKVLAPGEAESNAACRVISGNDPDVSAAFNAVLDGLPPADAIDLIKGSTAHGRSTLDLLRTANDAHLETGYFKLLDRQQQRLTATRAGERQHAEHQSDQFRRRHLVGEH
ncbi:hypothetical protein [Pseudomonas petrae]|uniref:ShET2 enterotoxin, N-terminal region n=1 Tax=Pseudomonas petrae TaxID=2912190 RepID=A0ABS9I6T8_9PSED|nr:hypothetical protein [Pseudomonas petrae]MCF7534269.1 hypothetical protein [Pseudomonas petrae]MCF7539689.1 hypothetical protein [Pseudomonas petrae]MCF7543059.1 hypothetical protein [Pseudomonas petrae]MCF7557976.1 hypothetical protein [Pseudomonas petrae]